MKHLFALFVVALLAGVTSCNKGKIVVTGFVLACDECKFFVSEIDKNVSCGNMDLVRDATVKLVTVGGEVVSFDSTDECGRFAITCPATSTPCFISVTYGDSVFESEEYKILKDDYVYKKVKISVPRAKSFE